MLSKAMKITKNSTNPKYPWGLNLTFSKEKEKEINFWGIIVKDRRDSKDNQHKRTTVKCLNLLPLSLKSEETLISNTDKDKTSLFKMKNSR